MIRNRSEAVAMLMGLSVLAAARAASAAPAPVAPAWAALLEPGRSAADASAACERGDGRACHDAALRELRTRGASSQRAYAMAGRSCEAGDPAGCALQGWMVQHGIAGDGDPSLGYELHAEACKRGHAGGCYEVGLAQETGAVTDVNLPAAWLAFHRSCRAGFRPACAHRLARSAGDETELRRDCAAGRMRSCLHLGLLLQQTSNPGAAGAFRTACLRGGGLGCYLLALWTERRQAEVDVAPLALLFEGGCWDGIGPACARLGRLRMSARRDVRDLVSARWAFEHGCEAKDRDACAGLALPAVAKVPADLDEAERACREGDAISCAVAGEAYAIGWDGKREVPTDWPRAAPLLEKACHAEHLGACTWLAVIQSPDDEGCTRARPRLQRACAAGVANACGMLGGASCRGEPSAANLRRAFAHLEMGCTGGDTLACANLAKQLWAGEGAKQDRAEASQLASSHCWGGSEAACDAAASFAFVGCEAGERRACYDLGFAYQRGRGVAKSPENARAAFREACRLGLREACVARDEVPDGEPAEAPDEPAEAPDASGDPPVPADVDGAWELDGE